MPEEKKEEKPLNVKIILEVKNGTVQKPVVEPAGKITKANLLQIFDAVRASMFNERL